MDTLPATRQLCTFYVERLFLGVDVTDVQEVIRYQEMTPVPLVHAAIKGLINLRGQIVTAVDLRERLHLSPRLGDRRPMNLVIQTGHEAVSLLVDEIGEVLEVRESDFEPMPYISGGPLSSCITGAYKLHDQLLLRLDVKKTLEEDLCSNLKM